MNSIQFAAGDRVWATNVSGKTKTQVSVVQAYNGSLLDIITLIVSNIFRALTGKSQLCIVLGSENSEASALQGRCLVEVDAFSKTTACATSVFGACKSPAQPKAPSPVEVPTVQANGVIASLSSADAVPFSKKSPGAKHACLKALLQGVRAIGAAAPSPTSPGAVSPQPSEEERRKNETLEELSVRYAEARATLAQSPAKSSKPRAGLAAFLAQTRQNIANAGKIDN